jgi:hypothetical protein
MHRARSSLEQGKSSLVAFSPAYACWYPEDSNFDVAYMHNLSRRRRSPTLSFSEGSSRGDPSVATVHWPPATPLPGDQRTRRLRVDLFQKVHQPGAAVGSLRILGRVVPLAIGLELFARCIASARFRESLVDKARKQLPGCPPHGRGQSTLDHDRDVGCLAAGVPGSANEPTAVITRPRHHLRGTNVRPLASRENANLPGRNPHLDKKST